MSFAVLKTELKETYQKEPLVQVARPENVAEMSAHMSRPLRFACEFLSRIKKGTLTVTLPNGKSIRFGGVEEGPHGTIIMKDEDVATRAMKRGPLGVAESYFAGHWTTKDLTAFLEVFCVNPNLIDELIEGRPVLRMALLISHWFNRNSRKGSKRNIHAHYDLGNQFYSQWLDPTMTYSSALFEGTDDLCEAQQRKYEVLARQIDLADGHHVLEVGCGWGGFAEYAAQNVDAKVTGITISREQYDFAKKRIFNAGLNEKVEIRLQDYRDTTGIFDRIASIEMFEAVGQKYWPAYFDMIHNRLTETGRAGIQVITIQDEMFDVYQTGQDFIQRYVFPGGMLPCPSALKSVSEKAGLKTEGQQIFGHDYARTVAIWRTRFLEMWPNIHPLGFDDHFRRLWEYYLSYCEAGFKSGNIDVRQIVYSRA